ncbi:zinc finger protein 583-like isoform X2 [Artemia franciscana]|uniref:zinc finger protein 583-like isoform X2 n=1 Tax=Artemia franciscana TaxID=6661 RepID=UPI0032D9DE60
MLLKKGGMFDLCFPKHEENLGLTIASIHENDPSKQDPRKQFAPKFTSVYVKQEIASDCEPELASDFHIFFNNDVTEKEDGNQNPDIKTSVLDYKQKSAEAPTYNKEKIDQCSKNKTNLKKKFHQRIELLEKPEECSRVGGEKFFLGFNLKSHQRSYSEKKTYECKICQKTFFDSHSLGSHRSSHPGKKTHECEICEKRFYSRYRLQMHQKTHSGEKDHECEVCKKVFSRPVSLRVHQKMHFGEKDYECEVCKKKFLRLNSLRVHQKIHSGEKDHECEVCKRKFIRFDNLKNHQKIHSGEKDHECEVCKRKFIRFDNLKRHQNTHSKEKRQ